MRRLPPFPVDDQTLDLLSAAVAGTAGEGGRSSVGELCDLYSQLGGSDTRAVVDPDVGGSGIAEMRDPRYHPNDIIAALADEVRRLRARPSGEPEHCGLPMLRVYVRRQPEDRFVDGSDVALHLEIFDALYQCEHCGAKLTTCLEQPRVG
jgi:hypothetical protein